MGGLYPKAPDVSTSAGASPREGGMSTAAYGGGGALRSDIFPGLEIPLETVFAE
ncbi:MAG: hypothetical protein LBU28_08630 [Spirochaetaceae bacterium]|nr:hypothetical protein [Spirochaetaceae bacterium]